jgi:hypothetical protein
MEKNMGIREILDNQPPVDPELLSTVKRRLALQGVNIDQSEDWNRYLERRGLEALVFSKELIVMHTKVSTSGMYEELIHLAQLRKAGDEVYDYTRNLAMEIAAKEKILRNKKAYKISDYEVDFLTESINDYKIRLWEAEKSKGG